MKLPICVEPADSGYRYVQVRLTPRRFEQLERLRSVGGWKSKQVFLEQMVEEVLAEHQDLVKTKDSVAA